MSTGLDVGVLAAADALVAATQFGRLLYPENGVCLEDERVSVAVRAVLDDRAEVFPVELALGWTHLLVGPRVVPMPPGTPQAVAEAEGRLCAPPCAVCDYCSAGPAPVTALLPVPAGAQVAVLLLCQSCGTALPRRMPTAHFITLEP